LIEATIISTASEATDRAPATARLKALIELASFRDALSTGINAVPRNPVAATAHSVAATKHHVKSAAHRATSTKSLNKPIEAAPGEEAIRVDQPATSTCDNTIPFAIKDFPVVQVTTVVQQEIRQKRIQGAGPGSAACIGTPTIPADQTQVAPANSANESLFVIPQNPDSKEPAKAGLADASACTQTVDLDTLVHSPRALNHSVIAADTVANSQSMPSHRSNIAELVVGSSSLADGAVQPQEVRTITSTPTVLEVGFNGTHGWLRVRAELGHTGEISASLTTASPHVAETLHKDLSAITAYLSTEQVGISSMVVNAAAESKGGQFHESGSGHGGEADTQGQQNSRRDESHLLFDDPTLRGEAIDWAMSSIPAAVYAGGGGGWLSVRV
jgi:hypothetical protein